MSIFSGLEEIVEADCSLAEYTWFGLGGKADYLVKPRTVDELRKAVRRCNENNLPIHVLGYGSNLLIKDEGVRGAVIKLDGEEFKGAQFKDAELSAGAGANLNKLVLESVRKGLSGLEPLMGIPGSVGGAVKMNAGGNFGDIGTSVDSVTLMDKDGRVFEKSKPELVFDYRRTNIAAKFILGAKITLTAGEPQQIMQTMQEIWIYKKNT